MGRFAKFPRAAAAFVSVAGAVLAVTPSVATAQGAKMIPRSEMLEGSAYDGDFLIVGIGGGFKPSYDGSNDYSAFGAPLVMGSLAGVDISPRGSGLALDFIPDSDAGVFFDAGVAVGLRLNRTSGIKDEVVKTLGKLDRAVEVGPTVGIGYSGVLHGYDSISFSLDTMWDVAGAHKGMVINPSLVYFTPLSRSTVAALSLNAEYGNAKFRDYYYSITPEQSAVSGLAAYTPDGGGLNKAGATLFLARDLDGDLTNGGFGIALVANYSRMLGDAKHSPIVADRGSSNQWFGAVGVGYVF